MKLLEKIYSNRYATFDSMFIINNFGNTIDNGVDKDHGDNAGSVLFIWNCEKCSFESIKSLSESDALKLMKLSIFNQWLLYVLYYKYSTFRLLILDLMSYGTKIQDTVKPRNSGLQNSGKPLNNGKSWMINFAFKGL